MRKKKKKRKEIHNVTRYKLPVHIKRLKCFFFLEIPKEKWEEPSTAAKNDPIDTPDTVD